MLGWVWGTATGLGVVVVGADTLVPAAAAAAAFAAFTLCLEGGGGSDAGIFDRDVGLGLCTCGWA